MNKQARIIQVDGKEIPTRPANPEEGFTLSECYDAVRFHPEDKDIMIEVVNLSHGMLMIVDEEGILKNLPINETATMMAATHALMGSKGIQGHVLVCPSEMFQ